MEGIENINSLSINEETQLDIDFKKAPDFVQERILMYDVEKLSDETVNSFEGWHWLFISLGSPLSSGFVRKYSDRLKWEFISLYWRNLSEDFIREFADRLNWDYVSLRQPLSDAFVLEFADRLNLEELFANITYENISEEVREQLGMDEIIARIEWMMVEEDSDDSGYEEDSEDEVAPPPGEDQ